MREGTGKNMSRPATKEERLAAKLRENLRRRKAQGRALLLGEAQAESPENGLSNDGGES